jgi:hypothetical protein
MSVTVYSTFEMMEVQRRLPKPTNFWIDKFFPRTFTSTQETILFDDIGEEDQRLAPFVAPMAQGKVLKELGYVTRSFRPAYVKPKMILRPEKVMTRFAGEQIGGSLSLQQRRILAIADMMSTQRGMIERRWDWMAFQALAFGQVVVEGEDYPAVTVNFGRDNTLTYTLSGDARWTVGANPDPLGDIQTARMNAYDKSSYPVNTLVFGLGAWGAFTKNTDVQNLLKTDVRGSSTDFRAAVFNNGEPWAYEGWVRGGPNGQGGYDCWTYQGRYRDDTGASQLLMNTNDVVGVGSPNGVRAFGAIFDLDSLQAVPMFPKMWRENDPSAEFVMTQSAPLMVPLRPNSTFRIRVG